MNEELKRLLDNARASGANASQLQGIVDAYNLKKKDTPVGTGDAIIGAEIGGTVGSSKAQSEPLTNNDFAQNNLDINVDLNKKKQANTVLALLNFHYPHLF